jgi:hypothetical protein
VWNALKASIDTDMATAKMLLDSAHVTMENDTISVCWDRRGIKYEIPTFVINDPVSFTSGKLAPTKAKKPVTD